MSLQRRLTLYLFGLVIGGMMAYKFYGDRITNGKWLPENKVKQRLVSTLIKASPEAEQQLAQWSTDLTAVRLSLDSATLDLSASKRTPDSIYYSMRTTVAGRNTRLTIAVLRDFDIDTTATLQRIVLIAQP